MRTVRGIVATVLTAMTGAILRDLVSEEIRAASIDRDVTAPTANEPSGIPNPQPFKVSGTLASSSAASSLPLPKASGTWARASSPVQPLSSPLSGRIRRSERDVAETGGGREHAYRCSHLSIRNRSYLRQGFGPLRACNRPGTRPGLACRFVVDLPGRNRTGDPILTIDARGVHNAAQHLMCPHDCADQRRGRGPRIAAWGYVRLCVAQFLAYLWHAIHATGAAQTSRPFSMNRSASPERSVAGAARGDPQRRGSSGVAGVGSDRRRCRQVGLSWGCRGGQSPRRVAQALGAEPASSPKPPAGGLSRSRACWRAALASSPSVRTSWPAGSWRPSS
jgi:hypothetical protein